MNLPKTWSGLIQLQKKINFRIPVIARKCRIIKIKNEEYLILHEGKNIRVFKETVYK